MQVDYHPCPPLLPTITAPAHRYCPCPPIPSRTPILFRFFYVRPYATSTFSCAASSSSVRCFFFVRALLLLPPCAASSSSVRCCLFVRALLAVLPCASSSLSAHALLPQHLSDRPECLSSVFPFIISTRFFVPFSIPFYAPLPWSIIST